MVVRSRTYQAAIAERDISRAKLAASVASLDVERAKREALERHVQQQHMMMQFICARINQLELERALLVRKLTNVEIPVPTMTATPGRPSEASKSAQTLSSLAGAAMFEDMGDEAAKALGLRWDENGRVVYAPAPDEEQEPADVSTR